MAWFLDGLAIIFILLLGYNGFTKGLIEEFGRLLGLVLAILISMSNTTIISMRVNDVFPLEEWVTRSMSFTFLFIATLLFSRLLTKMLHIALLSHSNQLMNRSLGFTFIVMIFTWFIALLPLHKWTMVIENNSRLARLGNEFRISLVSFFNWDDPIYLGESYIKQLTQP